MAADIAPSGKQVREFAPLCEVSAGDGGAMLRTQFARIGNTMQLRKTQQIIELCVRASGFEMYRPPAHKKKKSTTNVVLSVCW